MPHRPTSSASASTAAVPPPASALPVNGVRGDAAAQIMRQPAGLYHPAGIVTPVVTSQQWMASPSSSQRVMAPMLEKLKSADSTDRSTKHDEEGTVATLATESSADEREATASALLMVSAAARRSASPQKTPEHESSSEQDPSEAATVPLKKRKKHLDFLRRNQQDTADSEKIGPIHVSPMSHTSASSHVEGRTVSREEVTPDRPGRALTSSQRSTSYDSKESPYNKDATQTLLDSSKIHNAADISLPPHLGTPHFPSVLHQVLSDSEYAGTVMTWLPDGEAWKVLRWDALRREVLPRYFHTLRDENGAGCGTIDAFLWHLVVWGFEEIKDGTDVGAYKHELFIRGAQKLCSKMRLTTSSSVDKNDKVPSTVTPSRGRNSDDRSMLQVPSLATVSRPDSEHSGSNTVSPNKRPRYEDPSHASVRRTSPVPMNWMGYRPEDPYSDSTWGNHYYSDPAQGGLRPYPSSVFDSRLQHPRVPGMDNSVHSSPQYAPPQVRSGRGAMRIAGSNRSSGSSSPSTTPTARPSFPVSNRGKGRKVGAFRSSSVTSDNASAGRSSPAGSSVSLEEAQRIGSAVQGVAMAVSRKTKRKLPLARNASRSTTPREDA